MKLWTPCDCGRHYGNPMVGAFWTMCAFLAVNLVLHVVAFLYVALSFSNQVMASVAIQCKL
jgi:hypothetical protein